MLEMAKVLLNGLRRLSFYKYPRGERAYYVTR